MKVIFLITLFSLPLELLASGCPWQTSADILLNKMPEINESKLLSKEEVIEDLDCLKMIIGNNYLASQKKPEAKIIRNLIHLMIFAGPQESKTLMNNMFNAHKDLVDLHISYSLAQEERRFFTQGGEFGLPIFFEKVNEFYENPEVSQPLKECDILKPVKLMGSDRFKFVLKDGHLPSETISCTLKDGKIVQLSSFPIQNVMINNEGYEEDRIYELSSDIVYIKPGSLINKTPAQQDIIDFLKTSNKKIIIDLVTNPGGDDVYAHSMARAIFTSDQHIPGFSYTEILSPLKSIGHVNTMLMLEHERWSEFRDLLKPIENKSIKDLLTTEIEIEKREFKGERQSPFEGQLIILTSSSCTSACETFSEQLSFHRNVRTVGKNTGGMIHYSNATTYFLPHSGIRINIPTRVAEFEHDAPEGIGYGVNKEMDYIDLNKAQELFDSVF